MAKGYKGTFKPDIIFDSFTKNCKSDYEETRDKIQREIEIRKRQRANKYAYTTDPRNR